MPSQHAQNAATEQLTAALMASAAFGGGGQGTQIPPSGTVQPQQPFGAASVTPQAPPAAYEAELAAAEAIPLPEEDDDFEAVPTPSAITEPTTIVSETPMAISFSVHGETTIPSDGVDHQVSIALLPFEAKISYITVPRMDPRVFLQCEVENSSEYRLLAGVVTVILDDSYVSKTSINVNSLRFNA
ncbi:hypothetical protein NLJ89_g5197 [Agrocybe chaxingu]|uniref:Uncharacterized protein n=1 Tax=Agrocybe chaxingu TaxID=84603 RepID=A0A9W8K2R9_9AGAR|nr:hypothetical protein NLJ89_g5197 [Agrocybe chaxingu]